MFNITRKKVGFIKNLKIRYRIHKEYKEYLKNKDNKLIYKLK